jgi:hypothetical protein
MRVGMQLLHSVAHNRGNSGNHQISYLYSALLLARLASALDWKINKKIKEKK